MFGSTDSRFYTPYAVEQYLNSAGTVTVVRVLGIGGYSSDYMALQLSSSRGIETAAVLAPSRGGNNGTATLTGSSITGGWASAALTVVGTTSRAYTISFNTGSANYITNVFSDSPQVQKSGLNTVEVYLYKNYKTFQSSTGLDANASASISSASLDYSGVDYSNAYTPYIQSQLINGARYNLFKVKTRSHGTDINDKYNVVITDVKAAGTITGTDYGSFSLQVRKLKANSWKQSDEVIVESWDSLTFDPTSVNYFARVIGDRYVTIDSNGKLTYNGDWPNLSNHIYVSDFSDIADASIPKIVSPMGFAAINVTDPTTTAVPSASFVTEQVDNNSSFNHNYYYGYDFTNADNRQNLGAIPTSAGTGSNVSMSLEDMFGSADASTLGTPNSDASEKITLGLSHIKQRKFSVPFQGGFDGDNPANPKLTGADIATTNTQGFDCANSLSSGSIAYKRAINAVSNPDEFDINLMLIPGVLHKFHSSVTNHAITQIEARGDTFYPMDSADIDDSVSTATNNIASLDTNYAGTYYPWVKIVDRNTALPLWVPPSVVMGGVIAYTDKVSHEWFAPAGLNRGGLTTVLEPKTRLTHEERDDLYENRVNPIATFPGQGTVAWGQKTLQSLPSALDRINVRRLLIKLKKYIASSSRYLVFEGNDSVTRTRFLNMVNPYLESVQQNSGLTAFRVIMDESNNTPEVIDRNKLIGQIWIQPTRTAEYIVLDFTVMPTGATFSA